MPVELAFYPTIMALALKALICLNDPDQPHPTPSAHGPRGAISAQPGALSLRLSYLSVSFLLSPQLPVSRVSKH